VVLVARYLGSARAALPWRPEWPAAILIALAWAAVLVAPWGHAHAGHGGGEPHPGLAEWTLMATAMMAPVALPALRHVGLNSIRSRRSRSMGVYLGVYVAVWAGFGVVALGALHVVLEVLSVDHRVVLALALALAGAWQATRWKRRAVLACTRTVPLPPVGLRADAGCARFALKSGWRCVRSCWAVMLVMALAAGAFWMAALTALVLLEERTLAGRRLLRPSGGVLALAAALVLLV
jgi:predicted metal-binding membrane protein